MSKPDAEPRKTYRERIPVINRLNLEMREVIGKSGASFALRVAGAGLGFLFNVILARLLGAQGTGVYYLALTITGIGALVSTSGMGNALLRFTAAYAALEDWSKVAGVYRLAVWIASGVSIVCTTLLIATAPWLSKVVFAEPALTGPLRVMALGILPMALITLHGQALNGLKRVIVATLVDGFGISLISVPLLVLLAGFFGILGATIAYVLAAFMVVLVGVVFWRRVTPHLKGVTGSFSTQLLVATSLPLLWVESMDLVLNVTDTIMLGIWADSEAVGIYGATVRIVIVMSLIFSAVKRVVSPRFAELYARGDRRTLGVLARNTTKLLAVCAVPAVLPLIIVPGWVLGIFGSDFEPGATALRILAAGNFVWVVTSASGYLLMMTGHEKLLRNAVVACAILNVALNTLLIPKYGITGAAVSTGLSLALVNVIATVIVYWKLSIVTLPGSRWLFNRAD